MALYGNSGKAGKKHEVTPSKTLTQNMRAYCKDEVLSEAIDKAEAEANKVFDALDGKYNVKFDVNPYTVKEQVTKGKKTVEQEVQKVDVSASFNCYDGKDDKGNDKPSQMVTLRFGKEGDAYVKVASYDGSKWNEIKSPKDMYESTKNARIALEKAGICREFLSKERTESDKEYTPAETLRYKMSKVVADCNKVNKTTNKDGKEVGEYYLTEVKDTSFTTKNGENIQRESFELRNHSSQSIEINVQGDTVHDIRALDFSEYDKDTKEGIQASRPQYNLDYLPKMTGLDANLIEICKRSELVFGKYEKEQEAPEQEWDEPDR